MNAPWSWIILIVCCGGFIHGLTGFGFGLVTMPLLLFLMSYHAAVVLVALLTSVVFGLHFHRHRAHYVWRNGLGLVIGAAVGVPLGVYFLVHVPKAWLFHGLGAVMCLAAVNELILTGRWRVLIPAWCGLPFGLVSGGLSGAFNMGGPAAVVYLYAQPWTKEQIVVQIQAIVGVTCAMRLLSLWHAHLITLDLLKLSAWVAVPLAGGLWLGARLFHRVPDRQLRKGVCAALGVLGLKYLLLG